MTRPHRPGNNFHTRKRPFLDKFEKGLFYAIFTIAGAGLVGLMIGLIITAVGK